MTQTSSGSNTPTGTGFVIFKPDEPVMGGLVQTGREDWTPWVGGKPKADWSGLDDTTPDIDPNQFRPTSAGSAQKSKKYRVDAIDKVITKGGDLLVARKALEEKMKEYGLDTISYLPDPEEENKGLSASTTMLSVLTHHSRFTTEKATEGAKRYYAKFDRYDRANNADAKELLYKSLDQEIKDELDLVKQDMDTFIEWWMEVVSIIRAPTSDRFEELKKMFRNRKIDSFKGHDIVKISLAYQEEWKELDAAGIYSHDLTAIMLNELMEADGGNESFLYKLRPLKDELDEVLLGEIRYMDYVSAKSHIEKKKLDVPSILKKARTAYTTLKEKGKWKVAANANDSKAIPGSYGKVNKATEPKAPKPNSAAYWKAMANALVQNLGGGSSPPKQDKGCYNCGEEGHFARDCPKPKKDNGGGKGNGRRPWNNRNGNNNRGGQGGSRRNGSGASGAGAYTGTNPSKIPPKPGEREMKTINGVDKYWCAKCSRWTPSHGTDGHGKKQGGGQPQAHTAISRLAFDLHPTCMKAELNMDEGTPTTSWGGWMLSLFGTMWWFYLLGCSQGGTTNAIPCLQADALFVAQLSHMGVTMLIQHVLANLQVYFPALLAGIAGFGTLYGLHSTLKDEDFRTYRARGGENIRKQWFRYHKKQFKECHKCGTRNWRHARHTKYIPDCDRNLLVAPERVKRLPRPQRRLAPVSTRLWHVESFIIKAKHEIQTLRSQLERKCWSKGPRTDTDLNVAFSTSEDLYNQSLELRKFTRRKPRAVAVRAPKDWKLMQKRRRMQSKRRNMEFKYKSWAIGSRHNPIQVNWPRLPHLPRNENRFCGTARMVNVGSISSSSHNSVESGEVLFDTGANCCITPNRGDFVGTYTKTNSNASVDGIGKGLHVAGFGHVAWTFKGEDRMYRTLKLPCYHVPSSNTRIASVGVVLKSYPGEDIKIDGNMLRLSGNPAERRSAIVVPYCPTSRLPFALAEIRGADSESGPQVYKRQLTNPMEKVKPIRSLTESSNYNLSQAEKELLRWHYRLGHIGMQRVQWLFRRGCLSSSHLSRQQQQAAAKLCKGPLCTACQYAKQRRKTEPGKREQPVKEEQHALKREQLYPGQLVSVDHFHSSLPGRRLDTFGKEHVDDKYIGGAIFVDHATGLIDVQLQTSLNSHHTLHSKAAFEEYCQQYGVVVQNYLTDNGTSFRNADFTAELKEFHQSIKHAAAGAHHRNGIAERGISTVLSLARAQMHHQALHWSDVSDPTLWTAAVLHSVWIVNHIQRQDTGLSPFEMFTRRKVDPIKLQDLHVWGCPAYVLDPTISNGHKLPRWQPRSSRSAYVGVSPKHTSVAARVLNLDTGKITTQFHVMFDDWFQTVSAQPADLPDFDTDEWYKTFGATEWQYIPDDGDPPGPEPQDVHQTPTPHEEQQLEQRERVKERTYLPHTGRSTTVVGGLLPENDPTPRPLPEANDHLKTPPPSTSTAPLNSAPRSFEQSPKREKTKSTSPGWFDVEEARPASTPATPSNFGTHLTSPSSSGTQPRSSRRLQGLQPEVTPDYAAYTHLLNPDPEARHWERLYAMFVTTSATPTEYHEQFAGKAAAKKNPDTYSWDEAMASPYRKQFLEAAGIEIDALVEHGTWFEDLVDNATNRIVPSQWVFRIKRTADGEIKKFKARLVLRGDLQEYEGETFSPVAAWSTVRLFLIICMILGWVTLSIDFSNAFVQSNLPEDEPVWMKVPRGYRCTSGPGYCLKLKKSLYGHKVAPLLWYKHVTKAFKELGLKQSAFDPCLWYKDNMILVQYVDDCGIGAPNKEIIDKFVQELEAKGLQLTQEGSFSEFLGIKFKNLPDGSIEMTQRGLIQKILEATKMGDCNPNYVPAASTALGADTEGEPMQETWSYRAICGMLLYLSTNTRTDIAYAVSQVCRFGHRPTKKHATAVKTIVRYLKGTIDKGTIFRPSKWFELDLYVDADYAGLYGQEDDRNPDSVKSRTGYIILLNGCPVLWKSVLQTHISQSTLEAEYSALSYALKTFLPLQRILHELIKMTRCKALEGANVHARVFEDNQGAYYLATNHRITNRTKYFLCKWHWFWEHVDNHTFDIIKCPTDKMRADYLTKQLPREGFENNRKAVQGW